MYAEMLSLPSRATDGTNNAVPNARWYFYAAGTKKALAAYADPQLGEEHPNPLICDNGGACPPVYFDPMKSYRAVLRSADGKTVLADLDPVNANLGAAPFGSAPGYREEAATAIGRPIAEKLRDAPVDVADFGVLDRTRQTDMTDVFNRAYAAAAASGRPLRLPAGTFAVYGLIWDKNIEVFGQGAGQTIFVPMVDEQLVIKITGDGDPDGRTFKRVIRDFSIHLHGRKRCLGLFTSFLLRTTLQRIGICSSDADFFTDDGGYESWAEIDNTGWLSIADQYCVFEEIHIERVRLGFVLRPDQDAGGGVNNRYLGLHICYTQVGAMMFDDVGFGVGGNFFENFKLQVSTHCGLYAQGVGSTTISAVPIEYSGFSRDTVTLQGQTVKGCSMQISESHVRFENIVIATWQLNWPSIAPARPYPLIVENHSRVVIANSTAAGLLTVDDTSTCEFDGGYSHGTQLIGARLHLQARGGYASAGALTPLDFALDRMLPNDAPTPMTPIQYATSDVVLTLDGDPGFGVVSRVKFSANPSSVVTSFATLNTVQIMPIQGSYAAGDHPIISLPVKAQTDTVLTVFPPGLGQWTFPLKAGRWQRIFLTNVMDAAGGGWMEIGPAGSDAPLVTFGPMMSIKNATATQFRQMSEGHRLNPNDAEGAVLRTAAAPTAGSWYTGAKVYNSNLSSSVLGWRCIAAGTPGAWETISKIVRKNAGLTPATGYALPGDASDMQVRLSDANAVLQGRINRTAPGVIAGGTVIGTAPAGYRPLTTLRSVMLSVNDGASLWETVPAQLDAATGNLSLLKATTISAANINVSAAFAVAAPT